MWAAQSDTSLTVTLSQDFRNTAFSLGTRSHPRLAFYDWLRSWLNPSGDDMLVGMMAVLYATYHTAQLSSLLPTESQLTALTTSVSASYLYYAKLGYFSTTLHTLLRRLACGSQGIAHSLESMLHHGHTSGADTLLGMDLTLRWQHAHQRRGEYNV